MTFLSYRTNYTSYNASMAIRDYVDLKNVPPTRLIMLWLYVIYRTIVRHHIVFVLLMVVILSPVFFTSMFHPYNSKIYRETNVALLSCYYWLYRHWDSDMVWLIEHTSFIDTTTLNSDIKCIKVILELDSYRLLITIHQPQTFLRKY